MIITQQQLKEVLKYYPKSGKFIWIKHPHAKKFLGKEAGCLNKLGYIQIYIRNNPYYAHRLAFLYMDGIIPDEVDHADGDRSNNKWSNIRKADRAQNNANRKTVPNNTGLKGVCKTSRGYKATISKDSKTINIGYFATAQEAHKAYYDAAMKLFGEFARAA